jgi:hypothetical protein
MFKYLKHVIGTLFIKIIDIFQYFLNYLRILIFNNRDIFVPLLFLYFFFPFISKIFSYFTTVRWQDITFLTFKQEFENILFRSGSNFSDNYPSLIVFALIFGFFLFELIIQIQNKLKNKNHIVTLSQRFFAILPYLLFLVEMTYSFIDSCMLFIQSILPHDFVQVFFASYVWPILLAYSNLPGLKLGIFGWFIFYFDYYYVGRNKEKFSHFVRYHFMQSMLFTSLYSFVTHLYFLWVKRNPLAEINDFLGFNIYSFFLFINLICICSAFIGKETKITFMDEAILYHIGPRKNLQD